MTKQPFLLCACIPQCLRIIPKIQHLLNNTIEVKGHPPLHERSNLDLGYAIKEAKDAFLELTIFENQ